MNPTAGRDRHLIGVVLAASLASTIGGLPFNALPVMLGSLADGFGLDAASVGLLGSICFAGYLVGTLGAPLWMNRLDWRWLTLASAAGTAASFALSARVTELRWLYGVWALVGFFASTMTCLGMRILADLPDKVRAYGVRQGVELALTAALLFALPPLVIATWRYPGAALALAAVVALLGLSALWLPRHPLAAAATPVAAPPAPPAHLPAAVALPPAALAGLGVFFLFLVGNIGLWAFLERIAAGLKIAPGEMGIVFAVLKLLGGLAAFSVAGLGDRLHGRAAQALVLLGLAGGLLLLALASGFLAFALGAWLWEFAFTCGCVLQTAGIARRNPTGRAVLLVPAAFALSAMAGPALAGHLVAGGTFLPLLAAALASSAIPLVAELARRARR